MNQKAEALGMKDSRFRNASGMPDPEQLTTAMDMAVLSSRYIQDHPDSLAVHSTVEYEYNGIKQGNRNLLLYKNIGVDGLKTGHVDGAGYHLAATGKRGDQRMIAVVMGAERPGIRAAESQKLLEHGFRNFLTLQPVKAGDPFGPVRVSRGKEKEIMLQAAAGVTVTVARGKENSVNLTPELPESVRAPVQKGQALGKIIVKEEDRVIREIDLLASADMGKSLLFSWQVILAVVGGFILIAAGLLVLVRRPRSRRSLM
jgi:D-alanyl-D-alanine carboxypeptidase (penicillin-binding protein 5/6)